MAMVFPFLTGQYSECFPLDMKRPTILEQEHVFEYFVIMGSFARKSDWKTALMVLLYYVEESLTARWQMLTSFHLHILQSQYAYSSCLQML